MADRHPCGADLLLRHPGGQQPRGGGGAAVTDDEQPELFEEHRYDLQRVKGLLASTPIFGIDSSWGNGKSFVVDYLVKEPDIQAAYFVIRFLAKNSAIIILMN